MSIVIHLLTSLTIELRRAAQTHQRLPRLSSSDLSVLIFFCLPIFVQENASGDETDESHKHQESEESIPVPDIGQVIVERAVFHTCEANIFFVEKTELQ